MTADQLLQVLSIVIPIVITVVGMSLRNSNHLTKLTYVVKRNDKQTRKLRKRLSEHIKSCDPHRKPIE